MVGRMGGPGDEESGALGNVWGYTFGDHEVIDYCVIHGSEEVWGEGRVCFFVFVCGVIGGGEEAVICYDEGVVIEEF